MIEFNVEPYFMPLIFILVGFLFIAGGLVASKILAPHRPNEEKNQPYECGEDVVGSTKGLFNFRFLATAILFILFEAEILFLFPWAVVAGDKQLIEASGGLWGWMAIIEMVIFTVILFLGLIYGWKLGMLEWDKPLVKMEPEKTPLSENDYIQLINSKR